MRSPLSLRGPGPLGVGLTIGFAIAITIVLVATGLLASCNPGRPWVTATGSPVFLEVCRALAS